MLTMQEIFDKVKTHLLTQGCKSEDVDVCLYRGPNGTKCAIGCLINDEHYHPSLEGNGTHSLFVIGALVKSGISSSCSSLLEELQGIHDDYDVDEWSQRLNVVASNFKLKP